MKSLYLFCSETEVTEKYNDYMHDEIVISRRLLSDDTYLPYAIERAIKFIERSSDVYILVNHEDILTKILPKLSQNVILNINTPSWMDKYLDLICKYRITGYNIESIPPLIIPCLNLIDINVFHNFDHMDLLNHENIRVIKINNSNNGRYEYKCKLNLDKVCIGVGTRNEDGFLESFFDQCDKIRGISIQDRYVELIPPELSDGMNISVFVMDILRLDDILHMNFGKLDIIMWNPTTHEIYPELQRMIETSYIPKIRVSTNRIECTDDHKIAFSTFLNNRNNRNDASRFARVKPIMPSE